MSQGIPFADVGVMVFVDVFFVVNVVAIDKGCFLALGLIMNDNFFTSSIIKNEALSSITIVAAIIILDDDDRVLWISYKGFFIDGNPKSPSLVSLEFVS